MFRVGKFSHKKIILPRLSIHVLVPMTLSDLEGRNANVKLFWMISVIRINRLIKSNQIRNDNTCGEGTFPVGQTRLIPMGWGTVSSKRLMMMMMLCYINVRSKAGS